MQVGIDMNISIWRPQDLAKFSEGFSYFDSMTSIYMQTYFSCFVGNVISFMVYLAPM